MSRAADDAQACEGSTTVDVAGSGAGRRSHALEARVLAARRALGRERSQTEQHAPLAEQDAQEGGAPARRADTKASGAGLV